MIGGHKFIIFFVCFLIFDKNGFIDDSRKVKNLESMSLKRKIKKT